MKEMALCQSDVCEVQLNGVSEAMDLLQIDVEAQVAEGRKGRQEATCSRNVMRKQRNWERQLEAKKSKRKEEKQRKKLRRTDGPHREFTKRVLKAITKDRLAEGLISGPKLCVDLSMTDSMSAKEISRLAAQLRRLYGSNKKATRPFHLFLTNLEENSRLYNECLRMNDGFLNYMLDITEESCLDLFPSEALVYLTPDADEGLTQLLKMSTLPKNKLTPSDCFIKSLETLDFDKVYVLGGLVDESIQKNLSLRRARELSVQTARLPIDEYMVRKSNSKNFHSKILAINQVFDILMTFCNTGSWTESLQAWFPQAKGYVIPSTVSPLSPASPTQA